MAKRKKTPIGKRFKQKPWAPDPAKAEAAQFVGDFIKKQALPAEEHQRYTTAIWLLLGHPDVTAQVKANIAKARQAPPAE